MNSCTHTIYHHVKKDVCRMYNIGNINWTMTAIMTAISWLQATVLTKNTISQQQKKVCIWFYTAFFVHIPLLYQNSTYTSLYTRIFNFSHSSNFHIPFVYQNSHIPTTYQKILHIPTVYQSLKTPFLFFATVRHYLLGDITIFWIIVHYFIWKQRIMYIGLVFF